MYERLTMFSDSKSFVIVCDVCIDLIEGLTPVVQLRNSLKVNGGGITMALSVTSGGFNGRGIAASAAFLALTNSTGSSVLGAMY
jgi:hypothetical protein